ncbi:hypothetical protein Rsub_11750 [Raphidocelis subcapitata]|uniref:Uncharacterized protein n=1 Tax=Raphidocelis subcapitata TaxID=307507 RepID=A0A2V0PHP2_9CHLO|nr:hypothetical protein Rsub_11750 [Raphidocelis subcapitata]|eukprot:GBF99338.1 hypothetical protein Rsub_11750 [Raphidocelis subcapitata]
MRRAVSAHAAAAAPAAPAAARSAALAPPPAPHRRPRRRRVPPPRASAAAGPDFEFSPPGGAGARVSVFGVEHMERQPHIGEWVLARRPCAVVVETACHPAHGAAPGNLFSCEEQAVVGSDGGFFQRVAAAMREQGDAAAAPGGAWRQACENFNGEQLAYVAALATGAKLAFGDRPKEITYKRLLALPSPAQLDDAYAREVLRQYCEVLGDAPPPEAAYARDAVDGIMMAEREAVMIAVASELAAAGAAEGGGGVALVVGSAHLPGIRALWESGEWRATVAAPAVASSPLLAAPPLGPAEASAPGAGARRGMLDALMLLSVPEEVLRDMDLYLPPVPEDQELERQYAFELYSSQRMQLATLPPQLLERVVSGPAKGERFGGVLEPLRRLRPVNGGPGWDEDAVLEIRALDIFISAGGGEEDEEDAMNNAAAAAAA